MIMFIASTKDTAGMNIAKQLIDNHSFEKLPETFHNNPIYKKTLQNKETKLFFVNTEIVDTQFLGDLFNPTLFVFLSRHSSASGIPTLSVHTPGNLAEAKFGGKPGKVSISPACAMKNALLEMAKLKDERKLDYEVSYECTHHGPSLDAPAMFVEVGSSPKQWKDTKAAEVVADAAMAAVSECSDCSVVLGIGGPHYNKKFTKLALSTQRAFGHMIPKYALPEVDAETIRQCEERTVGAVDSVVLDWKGIRGEHKPRIVAALEKLGVPSEKV
ncbi:MAG TPA: D-tyrosyl-tRNA(Tyr) deacylase [Candidatus Bathyarchaeota archaeon]|nr:D-tyrosyl-tRNA(Tyr) deacylase [Candidatus Bathyarchaeota archaeon]